MLSLEHNKYIAKIPGTASNSFIQSLDDGLQVVSPALSYAPMFIDVGTGIYTNIQNHASFEATLWDAAIDASITGGTIWVSTKIGFWAGSFCPGAGNAVGALAGLLIGIGIYGVTDMTSVNDKSIRNNLKGLID